MKSLSDVFLVEEGTPPLIDFDLDSYPQVLTRVAIVFIFGDRLADTLHVAVARETVKRMVANGYVREPRRFRRRP